MILHVSTAMTFRGGEQQVLFLVEALKMEGIHQMVLCPKGSELESKLSKLKLPVETYTKRKGFGFSLANRIHNFSKNRSLQLIHAHDAKAHSASVLKNILFRSTPLVVNRRVIFPVRKNWFTQLKYNHPSVQCIVCVSKAVKEVLQKSIKHSRVQVLYSRVKLDSEKGNQNQLRKELGVAKEISLVGHVAAFTSEKGHETFVAAAKYLLARNATIHFVFAGKGPLEQEIKEKVEELGLSDKFSFLGFKQEVQYVFAGLDVLLFPSKSEGLGTSILDAFKGRTAVVASAVGGIPEMVIHDKTGLLVNKDDAKEFANQVSSILNDRNLKERLITGALERLEVFSTETLAQDILNIYRRAVE